MARVLDLDGLDTVINDINQVGATVSRAEASALASLTGMPRPDALVGWWSFQSADSENQLYPPSDRNPGRLFVRGLRGGTSVVRGAFVTNGESGSKATSNASSAHTPTGDFVIEWVGVTDWSQQSYKTGIGRTTGPNGVQLLLNGPSAGSAPQVYVQRADASSTWATAPLAPPYSGWMFGGIRMVVDVDNGAGSWGGTFYYFDAQSWSWKELAGAVAVSGAAGVLTFDAASARAFEVNGALAGVSNAHAGYTLWAGITQGVTALLRMDARPLLDGTTTWTGPAGETWTRQLGDGIEANDGTQAAAGQELGLDDYARNPNADGLLTPDALLEASDPVRLPRRLTPTGTPPTLTTSVIGSGVYPVAVSGSSGTQQVYRYDPAFNTDNEDFAFFIRVRPDVAGRGIAGVASEWGLYNTGTEIRLYIWQTGGGTEEKTLASGLTLGQWVTVGFRYVASMRTLYITVGGGAVSSVAYAADKRASTGGRFVLFQADGIAYGECAIQQAAFWAGRDSMPSAEALRVLGGATPHLYADWSDSLREGLVAVYEFGEGSATYMALVKVGASGAARMLVGTQASGTIPMKVYRESNGYDLTVQAGGTAFEGRTQAAFFPSTATDTLIVGLRFRPGFCDVFRNGVFVGALSRTVQMGGGSPLPFHAGTDGAGGYNNGGANYALAVWRSRVPLSDAEIAQAYRTLRSAAHADVQALLPAL